MKRVIIFVLSLLCMIVCSCEKAISPQAQFDGKWDVVITTTQNVVGDNTQTTQEDNGWVYCFGTDGNGYRTKTGFDFRDEFQYQFDRDAQKLTLIDGCIIHSYTVEVLKDNTFQLKVSYHWVTIEGDTIDGVMVFNGRKKE